MPENNFDIIIIGGGPAGLTAGLYAARSKMNVLLIEKMGCGGQSVITDWIENYPGFPDGISGFELSKKFEDQANKFGLKIVLEEVKEISLPVKPNDQKIVKTTENEYSAHALIIASGAEHKQLNVPGELELRGKGVSYCATCDGPFFKGKNVIVAGGGDSAVQEALYLTRFVSAVTLVHRRNKLRAAKILQDRLLANPKISIKWNSAITRIFGSDKVEGISIINTIDSSIAELKAEGLFIFVGLTPNTKEFPKVIKTDEKGYIYTDNNMATNVPGIFACGDVRNKLLRQVVTSTGDGATAAFAAQEYVENILGTSYETSI